MKSIKEILVAAAMMVIPFSLTSCEEEIHHYWYDDPIGHGYNGNWRQLMDGNTNSDDTKLNMAAMLSQKWRGELHAYYKDNGVEYVDTFEIDLDYRQVSSEAAAGTCTEYSWPVINKVVMDDTQRSINTYVWYIDDNYDINITYSNGDRCKIDYDDLHLGDYKDGEGTVFDGIMEAIDYENEYYVFWTNLFENSVAAKTRAGNDVKPYRIEVIKKL